MEYGAILRACRKRKGWTQEDLAHELDIEQADVSRFENDRKELPMTLFQKWAMVTGSQDVLVAFIAGMEGMSILTNILSTVGTSVIGGFISFLL
ncbi:XRE family transcriptional regulator [Sporosarcina newyorkensis 2681]|uniref:XRE family transcriptional regulator n=1 Tax=Sporosarcina newyorkensis 2681 TaxID=1027292 RepID=F9DX70_9BACL|nr:helix-turn-helix transcriptional regulator [Sporosarcina newyorkensis]EGQ21118.1 XRE family transcriptional regulator [Sporosarcina newyorkensis 2681]